VANRLPGIEHFAAMVENLGSGPPLNARIAIVVRNLISAPGSYRDDIRAVMKSSPLTAFDRLYDAAAAMAAAKRFARHRAARGAR
jgi:hypothetical protein